MGDRCRTPPATAAVTHGGRRARAERGNRSVDGAGALVLVRVRLGEVLLSLGGPVEALLDLRLLDALLGRQSLGLRHRPRPALETLLVRHAHGRSVPGPAAPMRAPGAQVRRRCAWSRGSS